MKDRFIFPAVFKFEEDSILVSYPDLEGCITYGESEEKALFNAKEALEGYLLTLEIENIEIPEASKIKDIDLSVGETIVLIDVWMALVRDQEANRSIKKTLTIPRWLNDISEKNKVNFSHVLQAALKKQLGIRE